MTGMETAGELGARLLTWDALQWLVAASALALSIFTVVRQHLRGRACTVSAWVATGGTGDYRLVLACHGPAEARHVDVSLSLPDGTPWDLVAPGGEYMPLPVPVLCPGDQFHVAFVRTLDQTLYAQALVTWMDGRRGVQRRETTLSLLGVPIIPESAQAVVDRTLRSTFGQW